MPTVTDTNTLPAISTVSFANWLMQRPPHIVPADNVYAARQARQLALGIIIQAELFRDVNPTSAWCDVQGGKSAGDSMFGYYAAARRQGRYEDELSLDLLPPGRSDCNIMKMSRSFDPQTGAVVEDTFKLGYVSASDIAALNSRLWNSRQGDAVRQKAASLGIDLHRAGLV